jgi:hypothetical protein
VRVTSLRDLAHRNLGREEGATENSRTSGRTRPFTVMPWGTHGPGGPGVAPYPEGAGC